MFCNVNKSKNYSFLGMLFFWLSQSNFASLSLFVVRCCKDTILRIKNNYIDYYFIPYLLFLTNLYYNEYSRAITIYCRRVI